MKSSIYRPPRPIDIEALNKNTGGKGRNPEKREEGSDKSSTDNGMNRDSTRHYTGRGRDDRNRKVKGELHWTRSEGYKDNKSLYKAPRGIYTHKEIEEVKNGSKVGDRVVMGGNKGGKWSNNQNEHDKTNPAAASNDDSMTATSIEQQQYSSHERKEVQLLQTELQALLRTVNRRYEKPRMSASASKILASLMIKIGKYDL